MPPYLSNQKALDLLCEIQPSNHELPPLNGLAMLTNALRNPTKEIFFYFNGFTKIGGILFQNAAELITPIYKTTQKKPKKKIFLNDFHAESMNLQKRKRSIDGYDLNVYHLHITGKSATSNLTVIVQDIKKSRIKKLTDLINKSPNIHILGRTNNKTSNPTIELGYKTSYPFPITPPFHDFEYSQIGPALTKESTDPNAIEFYFG